uniref:Uncharacterized protein n=1 Tax=Zea mays TaxID=4577 RepID=C4J014_MAIZE|nr:unknown [Zea mays]
MYVLGPISAKLPDLNTGKKPGWMSAVGEIKLSVPESSPNPAEAAAMRAMLAQWRIDVRWWRGGLPPTLLLPPLLLLLPGGVSGSTPPLMVRSLRYSPGDGTFARQRREGRRVQTADTRGGGGGGGRRRCWWVAMGVGRGGGEREGQGA